MVPTNGLFPTQPSELFQFHLKFRNVCFAVIPAQTIHIPEWCSTVTSQPQTQFFKQRMRITMLVLTKRLLFHRESKVLLLSYIMLCHVMSCHIMSWNVMLCFAILHLIRLDQIISAYIKTRPVILWIFGGFPTPYYLTLSENVVFFLKMLNHGTRKLLHLKGASFKSSITSFEATKLLTHFFSSSLFCFAHSILLLSNDCHCFIIISRFLLGSGIHYFRILLMVNAITMLFS